MADKFSIPLLEIDRAIRLNCVIAKDSGRALTLAKKPGIRNQGVGRALFVFVALHAGHNKEEICDFLGMTEEEYEKKMHLSDEYYRCGHDLFHNKRAGDFYYTEVHETPLLFYRKLILVRNYLRYRYDFVIK